jgi:hypothetical protein
MRLLSAWSLAMEVRVPVLIFLTTNVYGLADEEALDAALAYVYKEVDL